MATAQQVIGMVRSHAAGDDDRFLSIAEEIARDAGRSGRSKVADELTRVVASARDQELKGIRPTPLAKPRGELANLVRVSYPETRISDLVLNPDLERRIQRIVREQREHEALEAHGLLPRKRFLLAGPPGTGKTMTASALAGELSMPLFTVMLDGIINKYMGESAAKLRLVFDAMRTHRGVYFFDEVDALATDRHSDNDIGEARRLLTSFLQFLEEDDSRSVVVAATNLRTLLDPAIFRRFQGAFAYELPTPAEARKVLRHHLLQFDFDAIDWSVVDEVAAGLSHADLAAAADDAARDAVLDRGGRLDAAGIADSLFERRRLHGLEHPG